jgi:hypothetical protein
VTWLLDCSTKYGGNASKTQEALPVFQGWVKMKTTEGSQDE